MTGMSPEIEFDLPKGPFDAITATDPGVIAEVHQACGNVDASALPGKDMGASAPAIENSSPDLEIT